MAHKKILDRIDKKQIFPMQVRVDRKLYQKANQLRKKYNLSWVKLIEAFLNQFIEESKE